MLCTGTLAAVSVSSSQAVAELWIPEALDPINPAYTLHAHDT